MDVMLIVSPGTTLLQPLNDITGQGGEKIKKKIQCQLGLNPRSIVC